MTLGQPDVYRALAAPITAGRSSGTPTEIGGVGTLRWQRALNGWSLAEVNVPRDAFNDQALDVLRTITNRLHLHRDAAPVWSGVIARITWRADSVTVFAADELWWLARRPVSLRSSEAMELTTAALLILDNAYGGTASGLTVLAAPSGIAEPVNLDPELFDSALDELIDLSRLGIDFCCLGGEIRIGRDIPARDGSGPVHLPALSLDDFSDGLEVIEHGESSASNVVVLGSDGVVGAAVADGVPDELRHWAVLGNNQTASELAASQEARLSLAERWPPPLTIDASGLTHLLPTAPVDIDQLIPGAIVNVSGDLCGRRVASTFRLSGVETRYAAGVERVSLGLQPLGDSVVTDG